MNLTPKQEEFLLNESRTKVANWGRRSGKTTLFAYEALGTAISIDKAHITYYAMTYSDAKEIAWDIFLEVFGDSVIKKNETLLEIFIRNKFGTESKVCLKGWESVYIKQKGRGIENDLLLFDEVAFCRGFKDRYTKVLEPTLLTSKGRVVFGSTPNGFNDFYDLSNEAQQREDQYYSHATSYDNPFNDPEELEKIKDKITEDSFAQEYMADFRRMEGLVYKEFNRAIHLFDPEAVTINRNELLGAIDFGYTNPCAVLDIIKDYDNTYWVVDEWYQKGKTDAEIAEYASQRGYNMVYPDPENPSGIEELRRKHLNVREVRKGKGSITLGINKVRELLKQNKLKISNKCYDLIWEIESYHYPERNGERNESEEPVKENDHAMDALRYAIMTSQPTEPDINRYNTEAPRSRGNIAI